MSEEPDHQDDAAPDKKKPWSAKRMAEAVLSFLMIATGTIILVKEIRPLFENDGPLTRSADLSEFRSRDRVRFEGYMTDARISLSNDDLAAAEALFKEALKLDKIELGRAAEPMRGWAEILIEGGRYDAAEPLALIAAHLHPRNAGYVNPYAEILLAACRFSEAVDVLKRLELEQDLESRRLLEAAESKTKVCGERSNRS